MKPLIAALIFTVSIFTPSKAQTPAPQPKAPETKPVSPELAALLKYKPKPNKESKRGGSRVIAATRSGGAVPVKLAALAPAGGGISCSSQPRLWWWQSAATSGGELEFVITLMGKRPKSLLAVKLGPMKAGYNALDLSNPAINREKIVLEPGAEYQWSIGCFSGQRKDSVFVRLDRIDNPDLTKQLVSDPTSAATITVLSESGNWYELFDAVAFSSGMTPANPELTAIRARLLAEVGLDGELKP
jgi:Domain of Unknown Function (DUF928)